MRGKSQRGMIQGLGDQETVESLFALFVRPYTDTYLSIRH